ncbi:MULTISPECIES: fructose-specific PTS transporter subunit EIIC [Clavibacter]|uniref:PTS lactose transporter subunit IIC n=1 Tax=Clavibacter tessellarius TaxID=31965 RepID=A0A154V526_9MICO|nr:fructose-specific PTS transporter subunit EIIC [Clavibacter michiganensis]KZC96359.1 PTS lactose transporter subunit IIC [Clavibacter michiganensis subsp. tessellarius]
MPSLITNRLVLLDADLGADREHAVRALAERVVAEGRATDADALFADAWDRESKTATGMGGGLAIPHCRSAAVTEATLVMARPAPTVDFGAPDGPADLVFFIAAPDGADQEHLVLLSRLARSLIKPEFVEALRSATDEDQVVSLVEGALVDEPASSTGAPAAAPAPVASNADAGSAAPAPVADAPVLIAVTACPTGIAHTYMAADSLVAAAKRAGVELHVETQGSSSVTPVDPAVIARATAVIFAVDVDVRDRARFAGKPVIQAPVKRGIDQPDQMVAEAVAAAKDPNAPRVPGGASASAGSEQASPQSSQSVGARLKRWLLTGVSYMIPFVAGGGLLMALGFLLGGYRITDVAADVVVQNSLANLPDGGIMTYLGAVAFVIGKASMGFLVPVLAGYIAYAIADRPGIAPGFVAGAVSLIMGAGFLGGLVGGLVAGGVAYAIGRIDVPRWLRGLMPVVIIPLLASIVASGLMIMVLGGPIAGLTNWLNGSLKDLSGTSFAVLLGAILGVMMCIDLGGPINKVAYSFAVAGLGTASLDNQAPWQIMAAVMAAGMVPPLALALASTVIDRRLFSPAERENGKAAWLLGAAFISEGAIPFAAVDPLRVIPASIVGGAVTGAMVMGLGVVSQAPHGGVFVLFAMNGTFLGFLASVAVGTAVSAFLVVLLKRFTTKRPEAVADATVDQGVPVAA